MAVQRLLKYTNYVKTVLSGAVADGDATIAVESVADLPTITGDEYYYLTITRSSDSATEIVKVTGVSLLTLSVDRGEDNTTALAFALGDKVEMLWIAAILDDAITEVATEVDKVDYASASALDHQDVTEANTIAKLVSDAGGGDIIIHMAAGTYTFAESYTVPRNVTLSLEDGAELSIASTKTVTIKGSIRAGYSQLFTGDGTVSITQQSPVLVEWWGGYGDDSTDCQAAITAALAAIPSAGGVLHFSNGTYRVESATYLGSAANPHRQVSFSPGAMIGTVGTVTVTTYCPILAGRHQIFTRSTGSTGVFTGTENATFAYPEWFGAVVAGTDCRAEVEDAIAFLPTGGALLFAVGRVYSLDADIDVTKSMSISGGVLTLLATPDHGDSALHVTADDVRIEDLEIDISGVTTGGDYSGIYGLNAEDLVIRNVKVNAPDANGTHHAGIYLDTCERARISSVHVLDSEKVAITLDDCENCVVSDVTIKDAGSNAVFVLGGEHNVFTNIQCVNPALAGIRAENADYTSLANVIVDNPTAKGIILNNATNTTITGGAIKAVDSSSTGIELTGGTDGVCVTGMRIEGFTSTSSAAIVSTGAEKNIAVVGCNLQGNYKETDFNSSTSLTKVVGNLLGGVSEAYVLFEDEKANGTAPQSLSAGTWTKRELTKKNADTGGYATLDTATSQITLAPGSYRFEIRCPAYNVNKHKARLYDITNGRTVKVGTVEFSYGTGVHTDRQGNTITCSVIRGFLAISVATEFKVEHWIQNGTGVFPISTLANDDDTVEIYTQAQFFRVSEEAVATGNLTGKNHTTLVFDADSADKAIGTYAIGVLPKGTRIMDSSYEITSGFSHATVQLVTADGDDIDNALQGSGAAGLYQGDQDGTTGNATSKTTGDTDIQAVVTVATLTSGKLYLHLEYTISE